MVCSAALAKPFASRLLNCTMVHGLREAMSRAVSWFAFYLARIILAAVLQKCQ